jgi:hypothetical protein
VGLASKRHRKHLTTKPGTYKIVGGGLPPIVVYQSCIG